MSRISPEEIDQPDPLEEEFSLARLNMKLYTSKLKAELCASDPHYIREAPSVHAEGEQLASPKYVLAYETPNWGTRQRARQDLGGHLGIKPSEKVDVDLKKPVIVQLIEQPDCPEVPRGDNSGV